MPVDVIFEKVIHDHADYLVRFIDNLSNDEQDRENEKEIDDEVAQCYERNSLLIAANG